MSNKETEVKVEADVKDTTPVKQEGDFKIKSAKKMKNLGEKSNPKITKLDLATAQESIKQTKDAVQEQETNVRDVSIKKQEDKKDLQEVVEEIRTSTEDDAKEQNIDSPLELITDEDNTINKIGMDGSSETSVTTSEQKEIPKEVETQKLPENIDKLIKFMKETGGDVQDYARLNADYSNVDDEALLHEYYKAARPHLNGEEREFIIEDSFSFDEELDEARDVRKKKLAYKEEVAKAKNYLEDLKGKYYDEIKLRPGVTQEQQKATDFFNRYNDEQEQVQTMQKAFQDKTNNFFNDEFKGFDFKLKDKKFRYGVKDPSVVANKQADISNFIKTFLDDKGEITDAKGYHKALYAASNVDTLVQHFYDQGKTDAIKDQLAKSKNITTEPRKTSEGNVFVQGLKVKAISGLDSSQLKIKKKKFN